MAPPEPEFYTVTKDYLHELYDEIAALRREKVKWQRERRRAEFISSQRTVASSGRLQRRRRDRKFPSLLYVVSRSRKAQPSVVVQLSR